MNQSRKETQRKTEEYKKAENQNLEGYMNILSCDRTSIFVGWFGEWIWKI